MSKKVLADIKGVRDRDEMLGPGYNYWRV